ncbi:hypothetical protein V2U99_21905 [Klebsiella variicola]
MVQNSWGTEWGCGGFAVLSYADWLTNAMDAWVAALGVPGVVQGSLQRVRQPLPHRPPRVITRSGGTKPRPISTVLLSATMVGWTAT